MRTIQPIGIGLAAASSVPMAEGSETGGGRQMIVETSWVANHSRDCVADFLPCGVGMTGAPFIKASASLEINEIKGSSSTSMER